MSKKDAFTLDGWQHIRPAECKEQRELVERLEAVYSDNFLDPVSGDKPNQSWSIISDVTSSVAVLRSQLWPGYYGYHRCNTQVYGAVYIGDGIKNVDLPFML